MAQQIVEFFHQRTYQRGIRLAYRAGCRRFLCLWHRRAGKDRNALSFCLECMLERVGVYYHLFPSLNQGRRDLWDNVIQETRDGKEESYRMVEMFPGFKEPGKYLVKHVDDKEMQIELITGSIYQVVGADDLPAVKRLRGPNPIGVIFSEYAHGTYMEAAWDTLTPVFAENGGWALFAYTPEGFNHGYKLAEIAQAAPKTWYFQKLTIDDTRRDAQGENGEPVITMAMVDEFRKHQREEFIQQEYWCSFTGFQHGTIYGDLMLKALEEGRIADIPYVVNYPVGVLFDLGFSSDAMSLWYFQVINRAIRFIDYQEDTQKNMQWAVREMRNKPYIYGRVVLPWDGQAAMEYMEEMGFQNVQKVLKRTPSVQSSIETVRREFSRFYFDRLKCARGIECLQNYARAWDDEKKVFSMSPVHDQWSHGADSLRTGVEGGFEPMISTMQSWEPVKVEMDFDPRVGVQR